MNELEEYPAPLAAYSTRKLISTYVGETCEREMSGYISTWYDQSGNDTHIHWNFETETKSMLWDLQHEMAQDFQDIALQIGLKTKIKFPLCGHPMSLETDTINL